MPIYVYRCSACDFEEEYLQKVSAPLLTVCPKCSQATFNKKLTAAGFQLKGSGWYATDFKNSGSKPKETTKESTGGASSDTRSETKSEAKSEAKTETKSETKSATKTETKSADTSSPTVKPSGNVASS